MSRETFFFKSSEPLELNVGDDWTDEWLWEIDGAPVDLTGAAAEMHLRRSPDDPLKLLELTTGNGRLVLGGVLGTVGFNVDNVAMAALSGDGWLQLDIIFGDGRRYRLADGYFKTYKDAVR